MKFALNLISTGELKQWILVSFITAILFSACNLYIFIHLFEIKTTKAKIIKVLVLDVIFRMLAVIIIPIPYYRGINIISSVIVSKIIFKERIEKCILGETINSITIIVIELICSKVLYKIYPNIDSYVNGMYCYKYKMLLAIIITLSRVILCHIIKCRNITLNLSKRLSRKNKNKVILISIIVCMLIYFNAAEMTMFITDFPYSIFVLDITSLIVYFYISLQDIFRIIKFEEMNEKINNLEVYNKTLSIMYDNIRGFRHDFNNFVQALDGYVKVNNMEGIRTMSKSLMKDCKEVTNMGILDPKIINNPAVYSIITNKYYRAIENKINMNVEIMIDFKELNISTYELCRILGILLDNAIEAVEPCKEKVINVKFIKDIKVDRKLIIIENSFNQIDIDLDKIYEKGYSTKKDEEQKHGLGLWTVRKILSKSDNLNLFTSKDTLFRQQLEIYEQ